MWGPVDGLIPIGDTTHVRTSEAGYTDLYAMQDLSRSGSVLSVTVTARAWGEENEYCQAEPDGCYSYLKLRVNGYDSAPLLLATPTVSATWTTNPTTSQPWTSAEVNALEAGFKVNRASEVTKVAQLYVSVKLRSTSPYAYNHGLAGINNLTSISGAERVSFTFMTNAEVMTKTEAGVTWTYAYDGMGLLASVKQGAATVAQYSYDGLGRRVKAIEGSATTFFVYGLAIDPIWEKTGTTETRHVYANGMRIAKLVGGSTYYVHADALGSTWRITDASKNVVLSTSYEPFGRSWGTSGSLASTERYRFVGERNDTESGLTYLRARQYDPKTGRFTGMDPVLGALGMPQTLNRYPYAVNNPTRYTDPSGECPNCVAAGVGAAIGAFIGYVGCGILTGGWATWDCVIAAGAGAAVGALAGFTFGASLALVGSAGLGTATAGGGFTFAGASGLAAFTLAGAASGAVGGAADYLLSGGIALAQGREWRFDPWELGKSAAIGAAFGAALGAISYGGGKFFTKARVWWLENVRGLRNGATISSGDIESAADSWLGRGNYRGGQTDRGLQFWRDSPTGRFRWQARYEGWDTRDNAPHLNLEVYLMDPRSGSMIELIRNNHVFFYDF